MDAWWSTAFFDSTLSPRADPGDVGESKRAQGPGRDKMANVAPSFGAAGPMRMGQLQNEGDNEFGISYVSPTAPD